MGAHLVAEVALALAGLDAVSVLRVAVVSAHRHLRTAACQPPRGTCVLTWHRSPIQPSTHVILPSLLQLNLSVSPALQASFSQDLGCLAEGTQSPPNTLFIGSLITKCLNRFLIVKALVRGFQQGGGPCEISQSR